jgi:aspartate-semialdehyde dehydrogenase
MKHPESVGVVQFGLTGPVADRCRDMLARSDMPFELEAVATASHPELHDKTLAEAGIACPPSLEDVPITGIVSAIDNADAPLFFSGLQPDMASRYERRMAAAGHLVVTNSSALRMAPDVALVSSFVNPHHIDELYRLGYEEKIIAGGNCEVAIMVPVLAPIDRALGIKSMSVKTRQGWSGTGAREVPEDVGNSVSPIEGDEQEKITTEPNKILGATIGEARDILIGAAPSRAPWLDGHQAQIALILEQETSKQEIEELLREFEAPQELAAARSELRAISRAGGDKKWPHRHGPIRPVKLEYCDLIRTDITPNRLDRVQPMRAHAHVVEFNEDDPARVILEVSGHNLWQGAAGGNMLNAAYARAQGYLS